MDEVPQGPPTDVDGRPVTDHELRVLADLYDRQVADQYASPDNDTATWTQAIRLYRTNPLPEIEPHPNFTES